MKVSSAKDFKKQAQNTITVQLPASQLIVELRSISFQSLLLGDKFPDYLTAAVVRVWNGDNLANKRPDKEEREAIKQMFQLQQIVAREMFVSPRIVDDPGEDADDEIHIDWIEEEDLRFVFNLLYLPARDLESFRFKEDGNMELVGEEPIHASKTITSAGAKELG
jgi:hypothetical protein